MKRYILISLLILFCLNINLLYSQKVINYQRIIEFSENQWGHGFVISADNSFLISISEHSDKKGLNWIYWYKDGEITKKIDNAMFGSTSPDGKYYAYINKKNVYIFKNDDTLINKFEFKGMLYKYMWDYNSNFIFTIELVNNLYKIIRFDFLNNRKEEILSSSNYFYPIPVKSKDILYLLKNYNFSDNSTEDYKIVKYNINTKIFNEIHLPDENYNILNSFTISPDEKFIVYVDKNDLNMNIIEVNEKKVIIRFKVNDFPESFSWESNDLFFIFSMDNRGIDKFNMQDYLKPIE